MRRVVVTGMGIVSCLGNLPGTVSSALRECRSGIRLIPDYVERGLRRDRKSTRLNSSHSS